jgi:hypothetical protein
MEDPEKSYCWACSWKTGSYDNPSACLLCQRAPRWLVGSMWCRQCTKQHKWGSPTYPISYPPCKCSPEERMRYKYPRCNYIHEHHGEEFDPGPNRWDYWDSSFRAADECCERCKREHRRNWSNNYRKRMAGKLFYLPGDREWFEIN